MNNLHSISNANATVNDTKHMQADHSWVTVINPTNRRMLLQACDNCGVVKSENTVVQACSQPSGQGLISGSLVADLRHTA